MFKTISNFQNIFVMEKVIRNGLVAVLVSHGFGAGWYTWNSDEALLFHPKLVELVENDQRHLITTEWVLENLGIDNVYCGGASDLQIHWLPEGTQFTLNEYDGAESILTTDFLHIIA